MSGFQERLGDVVRLFRAGLGRNPEPAAIAHFCALLEQGATFHDIAHLIAGADEFRALHGPEDVCTPAFAAFLYRHGLNRAPEPSGEKTVLDSPNRGTALEGIAGSDEARNQADLLDVLYPEGAPPQDDLAYRLWLQRHGKLTQTDLARISRHIDRGMARRPTISLLMLAQPDRPDLLVETVASLERQIYPDWTLKIACPNTVPATVAKVIAQTANRVPGVAILPVSETLSPGERWQATLDASEGTYCAFIYPGDQLAPDALYAFASLIAAEPSYDLIYCDEDMLDAQGERSSPRFKSAWSREFSYVGDFIGQLAVFSRTRALQVGGVRHDAGELARYDLIMRVCEGLAATQIVHLPHVLYHRGRGPGREAGFPRARATLQHPTVLATVERHLSEVRPEVKIGSVYTGGAVWPYVVYPLPERPPLVSIVIPTKDNAEMLETCVFGVLGKTAYQNVELLVADNGSVKVETHDTLRRLARDPRVRVIRRPGAFNWSAINNAVAKEAQGELILFLNDDIEIMEPDWLEAMVRQASQPDVGVVGARLFYRDGRIQHAGIVMTPSGARHVLRSARAEESGYMGQIVLARDLLAVTGACMMVRRSLFEALGGFDETFPLTCNDVDFCLRTRKTGQRVVWTPHASLVHVDGATRGHDRSAAQIVRACVDDGRLLERWQAFGHDDPYVNANLVVTDHHLLLAMSERLQTNATSTVDDRPFGIPVAVIR